MAAGDISVVINSETKAFRQGVESGIIQPLEDAEKALEDLGKTRGPEQLEREMRDAQKATENLADETQDAARQIEREFRDTYRKVGDASDDGIGKVKAGAQELQREIGTNLGEAVSSIRGDLSDLGQVGQDTLGGLAATVAGAGPAGLVGAAALAAGATGLGLVTAEIQKQQEQAEVLRERMSSAYKEAVAAGEEYLGLSYVIGDTQDLIFNPERAEEYQRVLATQKQTGMDLSTIYKANAGDLDAIEVVRNRINGLIDAEIAKNTEAGRGANYSRELQDVEDHWRLVGDASTAASAKSQEAAAVTSEFLLKAARDAGTASQEVDAFGNQLLTLPDGRKIVIDADTGLASENVETFKGDVDGIPETVDTTVRVRVDSSAWDNYVPKFKTGVIAANVRVPGRQLIQ